MLDVMLPAATIPVPSWRAGLLLGLCGVVVLSPVAAARQVGERHGVEVGPFLQQSATRYTVDEGLPSADCRRLRRVGEQLLVETAGGWAVFDGRRFEPVPLTPSAEQTAALDALPTPPTGARLLARSATGALAGGEAGLFELVSAAGGWRPLFPQDGRRSWAPRNVASAAYDGSGGIWFVSPQGVGHRPGGAEVWRLWSEEDGLPYDGLTAVAPGPQGDVWLGTDRGVLHLVDGEWEVRQGRRWLPGDDVRDLLVLEEGTVWVATDGGVSRILALPVTLAEKATFFEEEIDRRHRRTEYGFVDSVRLEEPGSKGSFEQRDSDNDGLWTGMYGAGECFAYAATGSPVARRRARQAFEALRFLGDVTQGGAHPAPPGFVARTILPTAGPDPNRGRLEQDRRRKAERDRLWKLIEPRWPTSADGQWYWKSDTSSDELDGHYFFYARYFDLVAESETERDEVRDVVRRLTDHLLEHGYTLVDHDGRPTRWAVFAPAALNHDVDWWEERGLNSLSLLSYLRVAEHVTGDEKYGAAARRLVEEEAYGTNLRVPKIQQGPGTGNQSDDEMAFMAFYNLLSYEPDPELRQVSLHAFFRYWRLVSGERNPLFHFLYAAHGLGETYEDAFGVEDLDPSASDPAWLDDAIDTLKRYPFDRANWAIRNSHRQDIVRLRGSEERGYRRDGKVLPVDERFVDKWNHDPWRLDYEGDGRTLADGASFLLPYYLGLYHGFIREPVEP